MSGNIPVIVVMGFLIISLVFGLVDTTICFTVTPILLVVFLLLAARNGRKQKETLLREIARGK